MPTYQVKYEPEHRKWLIIDQATNMMACPEKKVVAINAPCQLVTIGDKGWLVVTGTLDAATATINNA